MQNWTRLLSAVAIVSMAAASHADGQTLIAPLPLPEQGMFAPAPRKSAQSLVISVSTAGVYDSLLTTGDANAVFDPQADRGGAYGLARNEVTYSRRFSHGEINMGANALVRYYPSMGDLVGTDRQFGVGGVTEWGAFRLEGAHRVEYSPMFTLELSPVTTGTAALTATPEIWNEGILKDRSHRARSAVGLNYRFSRRTSLSASASRERSDSTSLSYGLDIDSAGARLSYGITKHLSIIFGGTSQHAVYHVLGGRGQPARTDSIDAGVDYNRLLGRKRRTSIGFSTGLSRLQAGDETLPFRLITDARISRLFARTWYAMGTYHRGIAFVAAFRQPLFADSIALSFGGLINRRTEISLAVSSSLGEVGQAAIGNDTNADGGSARLRFALSRTLAIWSDAYYLRDRYGPLVPVNPGVARVRDRRGIRVGVDATLAILR